MKMMKKGYKKGGMPMTKGPDGKMVPEFAMDGKGSGDMAKKKKRSDAMDAVTGTGPAAPRKAMKKGGMAKKGYAKGGMMKKGYAKGGKVRGAGIARQGVRPCKMR